MIKEFEKKYQLWSDGGCEGWSYDEYDTLNELLQELNECMTSSVVVTQRVNLNLKEVEIKKNE